MEVKGCHHVFLPIRPVLYPDCWKTLANVVSLGGSPPVAASLLNILIKESDATPVGGFCRLHTIGHINYYHFSLLGGHAFTFYHNARSKEYYKSMVVYNIRLALE